MNKTLERAIDKIKALPADQQELAAAVLEQIAESHKPYVIPDAEIGAVLEGLAQAHRGEFASDAAVDSILRQRWR